MTFADENRTSPLVPSRRSVVRAAAWSVPAISVAAAAPAFATTGGGAAPGPAITFTSGMFWRPNANEIADPAEAGYWGFLPENSILWITAITNLSASAQSNVMLELGAPAPGSGLFAAKGFRVIDARSGEDVITSLPATNFNFFTWDDRASDGRAVVTLPTVAPTLSTTVTVVIQKPDSLTRGQSPSWDVTVTPPGTSGTISVPILSYADFLDSL